MWTYFAPSIRADLAEIKDSDGTLNQQTFNAQANLFLAERQFPAVYLREVLLQQEKRMEWLPADPALATKDLSLFGYHTLEDWFGPQFLQLASEVIINGAVIAEQKGFKVSREEALASLAAQAEKSFTEQQQMGNPHLDVANSQQYLDKQLRLMSLDRSSAADIWRQVLLFRQLMNAGSDTVFVDPLVYDRFLAFASERTDVQLFQLPSAVRLSKASELEEWQTYLDAVAVKAGTDLPKAYKPIGEIKKNNPDLLQKRYLLETSEVSTSVVGLKVPLKEVWDWELEESHWKQLKDGFPELGAQPSASKEERFAALEQMDAKTRKKADDLARSAIVKQHPEWIQEALKKSIPVKKVVNLTVDGSTLSIKGVQDVQQFQSLLDKAPLAQELPVWTGDESNYYKIRVLDRSSDWEVLSFEDAKRGPVLDVALNKRLEQAYPEIRESDKEAFTREDGSWKPFASVKEEVKTRFFSPVYKKIQQDAAAQGDVWDSKQKQSLKDFCANRQFAPYMRQEMQTLRNKPVDTDESSSSSREDKLQPAPSLAGQYALENRALELTRSSGGVADVAAAFEIKPGAWSPLFTPADGDLHFFKVLHREASAGSFEKLYSQGQKQIAEASQQLLMAQLVQQMLEKNALSLQVQIADATSEPAMSE
jgi:hypothetical protein